MRSDAVHTRKCGYGIFFVRENRPIRNDGFRMKFTTTVRIPLKIIIHSICTAMFTRLYNTYICIFVYATIRLETRVSSYVFNAFKNAVFPTCAVYIGDVRKKRSDLSRDTFALLSGYACGLHDSRLPT